MTHYMEQHQTAIGGVIGMIMSAFVLPPAATIFTTIFLAAIGAFTGFFITFCLKTCRNWLLSKFNKPTKMSDKNDSYKGTYK